MPRLILLGDSTRRRYEPAVRRLLAAAVPSLDVWAPDENCETSERILANLDAWVLSRSPDIVHLNCGLHDLRWNPGADGPQVTIEAYEANLTAIFGALASRGITTIWATSTPIDEARHAAGRASRRTLEDVRRYNDVSRRVAARFGAACNDLYAAVDARGAAVLGADGVHFTDDGYAFLAARVAGAIIAAGRPIVDRR
ncbi:MAG: GDSL-type esterase/lipase family protein [Anaerolineae bacterium]